MRASRYGLAREKQSRSLSPESDEGLVVPRVFIDGRESTYLSRVVCSQEKRHSVYRQMGEPIP